MSKNKFLDSLTSSGLGVDNKNTLELHRILSEVYDVLTESNLSKSEQKDVLDILAMYLTRGIVPTLSSLHPSPKVWKQFYLGVYMYGEKIRVKSSADLKGSMRKYAGQEGVFSYVAQGKVFIDFNDDRLNRAPMFSPEDLEVKV